MTRWVVDTSPLIFLAKLDRLDLLRHGADEVLAPPAVIEEVRTHTDYASRKIDEAISVWLGVRAVEDRGALAVLLGDLGAGEAETVTLSRQVGADRVIMDDLDGRRFARRLGIATLGTLGLLLAARLRGELPSLRVEIDRLRAGGFRMSEELVEAVLRNAGEAS
jgi:predicted nucleic acid-binding protein